MCFGGGGGQPEKKSDSIDEQQKQQEQQETDRKVKRRQEVLEKEVEAETPIKTSLTYDVGKKKGKNVMRGRIGRRALYTSGRGGIGYTNPFMFG